ncbi:MAG: hypothetical protein Q4E81_08900 [Succinatimonas sp.]|nr:hypothetical protein [Succinatimonas sp.]
MADYKQVIRELNESGITENHFQWYGFVLGLLCRNYDPSSRSFLAINTKIMNDDEPLPGVLVAYLTNYALDCQRNLKNKAKATELFAMPSKEISKEARLGFLADLAYGLSLGLVASEDGSISHKISNPELLEGLHTLSAISQVDPQEDLAEDDLNEVIEYMRTLVLNTYTAQK